MAKMIEINKQITDLTEIVQALDKYIDESTNLAYRKDAMHKRKVYSEVINTLKDYRNLKVQIFEKGQVARNGKPPEDKGFEDYLTTLEGSPRT